MVENLNDEGKNVMNDDSEPKTTDRAKTDGLAAIAVLLITAALIVLVVTRLV